MRLARDDDAVPVRRSRRGFPIVPLINIVLLLLVTVMLTGTLEPVEPLVVVPPHSAHGDDVDAGPGVVAVDAQGRLAHNGRVVTLDDLLSAWRAAPESVLRLRADRALATGTLLRLRDALAAAGVDQVQLVILPR